MDWIVVQEDNVVKQFSGETEFPGLQRGKVVLK
jgi:hypothetical protein